MQTPQKPKSALGWHRLLSPSAGVRVSPLCLGTMNFGEAWKSFMGECSKATAFEMMDYFYKNGGNFLDTANNYQNGESEEWIGEWMEMRGVRDEMVVATKYTSGYRTADPNLIHSNYGGNHTKSMRVSLESSLARLRTSYVDILYVHYWDFTTSIPELMKSLNALADQGKILYLGISDTPAWVVSKANQYARDHGLRQFVVYEGKWSAAYRDFEREIIMMCEAEGMGIAPWGSLGSGNFKTDEQRKSTEGEGRLSTLHGGPSDADLAVSKVLEKLANEKGTMMTSVALAYVMHKTVNVFPIVGGRKISHLQGNIEALSIELTPKEIEEIEGVHPFDYGFPTAFLFQNSTMNSRSGEMWINQMGGQFLDTPHRPKPIPPHRTKEEGGMIVPYS